MYRYFTDLDFQWAMKGGLEILSIRVDATESTRIVPLLSIRHAGSQFARRNSVRIELRRNAQTRIVRID